LNDLKRERERRGEKRRIEILFYGASQPLSLTTFDGETEKLEKRAIKEKLHRYRYFFFNLFRRKLM